MAQKPITVVIDPGHGGSRRGCCYRNFQEASITLEIATHLKYSLWSLPIIVELTRCDDRYVSLTGRGIIAANHDADLVISLHVDFDPNNEIRQGATIFCQRGDLLGRAVASRIGGHLPEELKPSRLWELEDGDGYPRVANVLDKFPDRSISVLCEFGFLSNPDNRQFITDQWSAHDMAGAVKFGIVEFIRRRLQ